MVDRVVATLTEQQREIYRLRFVEELTGRQAAAQLGISDKAASNEATIVQKLIADGFGALILMQEGRTYCPDLARILDDAAVTRATAVASSVFDTPPDMYVFTAVLRQRIVNHFNDCNVCDNCRTCDEKRRQLVGPYAPALIPILFAAEFRDRIDEVIQRVVERARASHNSSSYPNSGTPAAAAAASVPAVAGGLLTTAGARTGPGAGGALVSRLQSLVHKARESNRLPRWLRRAIPHDAGPGASITVVAAFVAALIVFIVVIAAIASALTSGGSATPQAGAGSSGVAAINTAGPGAAPSPTSTCNSGTIFGQTSISGTTATPVSAAALGRSIEQLIYQCTGDTIPVTCSGPPYNDGAQDNFPCQMSAKDSNQFFNGDQPDVFVTKADGAWIAYF
jgi:hypothetical protein